MSSKIVEAEINRFLASAEPEVICIKGKWGVGKTYSWKKYLSDARVKPNGIALTSYSYVSLFGLNSLEDLRDAIFDNTVSGKRIGDAPDDETFSQLVKTGSSFARRAKPFIELFGNAFGRKGVADQFRRSMFSTVREQIVCLDDLERAGVHLNVRDVLGLTAYLKDERKCKVVLLLNDAMHDKRGEWDLHFEKVVDTTLMFDLSSKDAVEIALTDENRASALIKPYAIKLKITNIRVIKKIERLALRLVELLDGLNEATIDRAVCTLVLASWSVQQPSEAPNLEFLRHYSKYALNSDEKDTFLSASENQRKIEDYPFSYANDLDRVIMDGVAAGYFSETLRNIADEMQRLNEDTQEPIEFNRVWDELYHGSLATDDDAFLDALYESAASEAAHISLININSAISMLSQFGREQQADELSSSYISQVTKMGVDLLNARSEAIEHFSPLAPKLQSAIDRARALFVEKRNPLDVVNAIAETGQWDKVDLDLLNKTSVDQFELILEELKGPNLRKAIRILRRSWGSDGSEFSEIWQSVDAALQRIAAKSPIRAHKVSRYLRE